MPALPTWLATTASQQATVHGPATVGLPAHVRSCHDRGVRGWVYNDRPDGVRLLPDRIREPARTEIEDEIWAWIVRGEDDAAAFVEYLDDDDERHGATEEELATAYEKALDVRRTQQREWGAVRSNLTLA